MIDESKYKIKSIICNKQKLNTLFHDNYESEISAELLRIESPSAEVQGHSKKEKITALNKNNVSIVMGNYYFTDVNQIDVKVEYTFGYKLLNEKLKIFLHHSSLPYQQ